MFSASWTFTLILFSQCKQFGLMNDSAFWDHLPNTYLEFLSQSLLLGDFRLSPIFNAENAKLKETWINLKFRADYLGNRRRSTRMKQILLNLKNRTWRQEWACLVSPCVKGRVEVVSILILLVVRCKLATRDHSEWKYHQDFSWSTVGTIVQLKNKNRGCG